MRLKVLQTRRQSPSWPAGSLTNTCCHTWVGNAATPRGCNVGWGAAGVLELVTSEASGDNNLRRWLGYSDDCSPPLVTRASSSRLRLTPVRHDCGNGCGNGFWFGSGDADRLASEMSIASDEESMA